MVKLLEGWKWKARPLQTGKSTMHHTSWRVGTDEPPPHTVLFAFDSDIIATLCKDLKTNQVLPRVVASTRTTAHMQARPAPSTAPSSSASDPWTTGADPWSNYASVTPATLHTSKDLKYIDKLQGTLEQSLKQHIDQELKSRPTAPSESTASGTQLTQLEATVLELRGQNKQMHVWFRQTADRIQAVEHNTAQQTARNKQDIQTLRDEMQNTLGSSVQTLQSTMKKFQADMMQDIQANMEKQSSQLEALLEKRARQA